MKRDGGVCVYTTLSVSLNPFIPLNFLFSSPVKVLKDPLEICQILVQLFRIPPNKVEVIRDRRELKREREMVTVFTAR